MRLEERVKILESAYVGIQADAVRCLGNEGVLEKVTQQKKNEQLALGKLQAERFGIQNAEEVFLKLSEVFGCASWEISRDGDQFLAEAKACKLCAVAKKIGNACPCYIYCLNPMEGMVKGISPNSTFNVKELLWEGQKCCIEVKENLGSVNL